MPNLTRPRPGVWLPDVVFYHQWGRITHRICWDDELCVPVPSADISDLDGVKWCRADDCWPDGRCMVCGRPSGQWQECGPCLTAGIAEDKALERRADG